MKIKIDSRKVEKGDTFIALRGIDNDGHNYILKAIENGASKIICEEGNYSVQTIIVPDTREYLVNYLKENYYDKIKKLKLIGITGTNGKTTSSYLLYQILNRLGKKCGYIGTIGFFAGKKLKDTANTTPDIYELYNMLLKCCELNCKYVIMEVSSQGLSNNRIETLKFDYAVFTNLTEDHLDFHKAIKKYALAKQKLFNNLKPNGKAIINIDDKYNKYFLLDENNNITYGFNDCDYKIANYKPEKNCTTFSLLNENHKFDFKTNLVNKYNIYNLIVGIIILREEKIKLSLIKERIKRLTLPKGRNEILKYNKNMIIVDYAHTPDAFDKIIDSAREITKKNVYVVFGCTGDREKDKRIKMSKIACRKSDYVIMTHDDPHFENQDDIYKDMTNGLKFDNYEIINDRKKAIEKGIDMLNIDDTLLILGKGHEEFISVKANKIPFNDMDVAKEYVKEKKMAKLG